jgi:hypothetical protein
MTQTIENTIKNRIYGHGKGWSFTVDHFSDLKNNESVKKALQKLTRLGMIRRLSKGLYDYPKQHADLGTLSPNINNIAKAIAEKDHVRVQPSGAYAANLIGLSEQVPARVVFATEGVPKKIKIGNLEIQFRRTTPKNMEMAGTEMGLIIQALRHFGNHRVDVKMKGVIRRRLKKIDPKEFDKAIKCSPTWIRELFLSLSKESS